MSFSNSKTSSISESFNEEDDINDRRLSNKDIHTHEVKRDLENRSLDEIKDIFKEKFLNSKVHTKCLDRSLT